MNALFEMNQGLKMVWSFWSKSSPQLQMSVETHKPIMHSDFFVKNIKTPNGRFPTGQSSPKMDTGSFKDTDTVSP
jgi:hypothetical protein